MKRVIFSLILILCSGAIGAVVNVQPGADLSKAIATATAGGTTGTLNCAAGTYTVPIRLNLPNGLTITGPDAVFKGAGNDVFGTYDVADITIDGVTIDGGWCGVIGNNAKRVKIRNVIFRNQGNGGVACGIWQLRPIDCDFSDNNFRNVGFHGSEGRGVFMQDAVRTHVDRNDYADGMSLVHAYWWGDNVNNVHGCTFNENDVHGQMYWHCLEIQYAPNTIEVNRNFVHDLGAAKFGMALSIATGGDPSKLRPGTNNVKGPYDSPPNTAYNVFIDGNVIDMSGKGNTAANWSQYAGVETMGKTVRITNNFIKNAGQAILYGLNTGELTVIGNTFVGCPTSFGGEYEHHDPFVQSNNQVLPTAPTPPRPTTQGTTQPSITNAAATVADNVVTLTWTGGPATVNRYTKWGDVESGSAFVPGIRNSGDKDKAFRDDQLGTGPNNGWEFFYTINGIRVPNDPTKFVQVRRPATTQPTDPPPPPDDPIIGIDVRTKSGKVQTFVPKAVQP